MPKATIVTATGATITIEGTAEEVEQLVRKLDVVGLEEPAPGSRKKTATVSTERSSIGNYVLELKSNGLFEKPQSLKDIKEKLAAEGHILPVTTLSGVMLRLVKAQHLRRIKEKDGWKYVKR